MRLYKHIRIDLLTISFEEMSHRLDDFKNQTAQWAPALYAATGNDGLAALTLALQSTQNAVKSKAWSVVNQSGRPPLKAG